MEEKEDDKSYLSMKDFEERGIKIDPNWTTFRALLVAASIAFSKLVGNHLKKKKKPKEKADKNPMKEEKENPSASSGNGRKLLADAMTSHTVFDCEELVNHHQLQKKIDISDSLKEHIEKVRNGTSIMRVIQKSLYFSDVSDYHNRLSIPLKQVEQEFLTQEEKEFIEKAGKLEVLLVEPSLNICGITLAKWNSSYVLIKEWNNVKDRSKLKAGDEVQIWSFRTLEKLCLALVILRRS
ncbi:uncharacterized protein LOC123208573 [Mangifera indica]|uniref:uncharacterized protein LOC123208573 n=1 Tax=Mangifera indica TaxID=29780 RepID=UPI001CFA3904|nr:uncharacterized protein LOC123208573 [Mangifera indica]